MLRWLRRKLGIVSPSRYYADAARRAIEETCALCGHPRAAHDPPCSDCVHAWWDIPCHADFRITGKR